MLKLIWRLISTRESIWVNWVKQHLIRKGSFWVIGEGSSLGSWIWKNILKYRELAKSFYRVNVHDGKYTSFLYDKWSTLGCLFEIFRARGCIDLGVQTTATLGTVMKKERGRRHRSRLLKKVEEEIAMKRRERVEEGEDIILWRGRNDVFKDKFSSKQTMELLRLPNAIWEPHKGIWFAFSTSKFSLISWLAAKNRLSTGDRMDRWSINIQSGCSFCKEPRETREHLFFSCPYSTRIWKVLTEGIMVQSFTVKWGELMQWITTPNYTTTKSFIISYVLQAAIHHIWSERNNRRHGEKPKNHGHIVKLIDVAVRTG